MKILLISMNFWPEETGTGPVSAQIARDLRGMGHEVKVICGLPYYPRREVPPEYRGRLVVKEDFEGIPVYRTWIWVTDEGSALKKILLHLSFTLSCLVAMARVGQPDVILSVSPPLFVPAVAGLASRIWRCKHVLRLDDILPDAAIIYGLVRSRWLQWALRRIERFNYAFSDAIIAICDGFARNLKGKLGSLDKVRVIPLYAPPAPDDRGGGRHFRREHGIAEGEFLVQYAGNIGHSQGLEVILDAASLLRDDEKIRFMVAGEGIAKARLVDLAHERGLANVSFIPVQPAARLDELLWAADVCLVTQRANVLDINVPSKIFNIMTHARPMIAAVNPGSDAAAIVARSGAGPVVPAGDAARLAEEIRRFAGQPDRGRAAGRAGREFVMREYSRERSVRGYRRLLEDLQRSGVRRKAAA
jgi:colanic acid biosynthesis glycosyl transferase WcaI